MNTIDRAKEALWKKSGLAHDRWGYVTNPQSNLVAGVTSDMIEGDYAKGSGQEWRFKIRAIHSSSALVANSFGRWKSDPTRLTFAGSTGFAAPRLEVKCPTGLRGTPPNLDVLLDSEDTVIGIESKFLEPLAPTAPKFSARYTKDRLPLCEDVWWSLLEDVRQWPASHLDVAQLVKHYLGLRKQFQDRRIVVLAFLYWKPLNAVEFDEYAHLAADLKKFSNSLQGTESVRFIYLDYLQLWDEWEKDKGLAEHAGILKNRYCVEI